MNAGLGFSHGLVVFALSLFVDMTMAASVTFSSIDIPDLVPGVDLRENRYVFSGALDAGGGLTLSFNPGNFADLSLFAYPPDLDLLVTQPDSTLVADGLVTLTAQSAHPSAYVAGFVVDYRQLAASPPGQAFELFDADFNVIATGQALSVPEPATALLIGWTGFFVLRRARMPRQSPS
jgi:hypothetical protein